MKLSWDIVRYIAGFITDPLTLESYGQCCNKTYSIVKELRPTFEKRYLETFVDFELVKKLIHHNEKRAVPVNKCVFVVGHDGAISNLIVNYIVKKTMQYSKSKNVRCKHFDFDDMCGRPLSVISAYHRITDKGRAVILRVHGTEKHNFDSIRRHTKGRLIIPGGDIFEAMVEYFDKLPAGSLLIAPIDRSLFSSNYPFYGFTQFVVIPVKKKDGTLT